MAARCLICGRPTCSTHLGIDVCRACAVFFRRHREKAVKLQCVNGMGDCLSYERGVFCCRKCRLDRFEVVLNSAWDGAVSPETSRRDENENLMTSRVVLSLFRLSAELKLRGTNRTQNESNYELIPSSYRYMNFGTKQLIIGLFPFAETIFPEFKSLPKHEKWQLICNFKMLFNFIDSGLRMKRRFGKDSKNFFISYTTYLSAETVDQFFIDCPDRTYVEAATKTLQSSFDEILPTVWQAFHQFDASEEEIFALMGLAFWSIETFDASDNLLELGTRYRTTIVSELTERYRTAISEEEAASRVGSLMCLLQHLRRLELRLRSDFEIFHMLGAFNDDTLTYQLQLMSV